MGGVIGTVLGGAVGSIIPGIGTALGATIGGGLGSSIDQSNAASSAAETSANAANNANALQKQMYDQTRADQAPWRAAGGNALNQLTVGMGSNGMNGPLTRDFTMADYTSDPGYNFRLSEGLKAIDRSAAAKGGLQSGAALKAAGRYGQDYASNEYQNAFNRYQTNQTNRYNRLSNVAGLGQTANNALQSAGSNYANNTGGIMMGSAANQGNALLAGANARGSAYQGIGQALGNKSTWNNLMNWLNPSATSGWLSPSGPYGDPYNAALY